MGAAEIPVQTYLRLTSQVVVQIDVGGRIVICNDAARRLFGQESLSGLHWVDDCVATSDHESEASLIREAIAAGSTTEEPRRLKVVTSSSEVRQIMARTAIIQDNQGHVTGFLTTAEDISDHSRGQGVLRDTLFALEAYQFALDTSAIVAITDLRGTIRHVNEQFCAISRYTADELLGQDHRILNSGYHARSFFKEMWATIGRGRVWRGDIRNRAKDGTYYWVATTIVPFLDEQGSPRQYVAIRFEITERKLAETALERTVRDLAVAREEEARRAEALREARDNLEAANVRIQQEQAKLIQAEKLSSIGLLASGVAHEINNPLAGVMNCVKVLSAGTAKASRREEYFRTAQDGLDRIQQIVRGLLDYARQRPLSSAELNAQEVVTACERLISPYLKKNRVELRNEVTEATILADRSRLMQALINILLNAIYVSPADSTVIVSDRRTSGRVGISVQDRGPGMPKEVQQRACDPFYTTKPEGEGTGLGLAVTASIVRAHDGELEFDVLAPPESGTTVTIWLPDPTADATSIHSSPTKE